MMIEMADKLNARVRGDEYETYRSVKEAYVHPDDKGEIEEAKKQLKIIKRKTRRNQILIHAVIFGVFALLVFLLVRK